MRDHTHQYLVLADTRMGTPRVDSARQAAFAVWLNISESADGEVLTISMFRGIADLTDTCRWPQRRYATVIDLGYGQFCRKDPHESFCPLSAVSLEWSGLLVLLGISSSYIGSLQMFG